MKQKLIIIGAGGHAKSVLDSLDENYEFIGFIDEQKNESEYFGYPILGQKLKDINDKEDYFYFIAIGNNSTREKWYSIIKNNHLNLINIIDKTALISKTSKIGEGCFIGKMAIINSDTIIGNNCIINTKALLEHGCRIGNNVNISTNTTLNGDITVKNNAFIGSSSTINGQLTIGTNSIIGSGSVVIKDIEDNVTAVGVPTKIIKK